MPAKTPLAPHQLLLLIVAVLWLAACISSAERDDPSYQLGATPWGAVPASSQGSSRPPQGSYSRYRESVEERITILKAQYAGERIPFRILALSGGGPMGAYGAGVLSGWTLTGTRPEFDVVTGISVGALMATYAFLGPEYDSQLQRDAFAASTSLANKRSRLSAFELDSIYDSRSLREILARSITPQLLDAVAEEYRKGRRLFVGTTNLDSRKFVIWDLGFIASSDEPNRVKLYRDVLLASASVPVVFQPVMIDVDPSEGRFSQMHVDGGVRENIFVTDYTRPLMRALKANNLTRDDFQPELYSLYNGQLFTEAPNRPVNPNILAIASTSIATLMHTNANNGIFHLWQMAMINGIRFNLAFIPPAIQFQSTLASINTKEMDDLFSVGFEQALQNQAWFTQEPPETLEALRDLIGDETPEEAFQRLPEKMDH